MEGEGSEGGAELTMGGGACCCWVWSWWCEVLTATVFMGVVERAVVRGLGRCWLLESLEMGLHAFSSSGLSLVRALLFLC